MDEKQKKEVRGIILAAGKGTRMKSDKAKVMHEVFFAPMLHHVIKALEPLDPEDIVVVTGHQAQLVEDTLQGFPVRFARQERQLGTAHAVMAAEPLFKAFGGTVLIICGDTPLVRSPTLQGMLAAHHGAGAQLTVMTTVMTDPVNYGRIVTDDKGQLLRIVEEKDASPAEKEICEINAGIYCVDGSFLFNGLREVGSDNRQGEFYLTDLVAVARARGLEAGRYTCKDPIEVLGVNSPAELAVAQGEMRVRRNRQLACSGVEILEPDSVEISPEVQVGPGSELAGNVSISGATILGDGCKVGRDTIILNCIIGKLAIIGASCRLKNCAIEAGAEVGAGSVISG